MFQGNAEQAMNFYVTLFTDAAILEIARYGPNEPGIEGSIKKARFSIGGQTFLCIDKYHPARFLLFAGPSHFSSSAAPTRRLSGSTPRLQQTARRSCHWEDMVSPANLPGSVIATASLGS
jgi:hypothetical protein